MSPPALSDWIAFTTPSTEGNETRLRVVDYSNCVLVFLLQGPVDRVASWVEAKRTVDALSGNVDVDVSVLFGDRDDIWNQLIARRIADVTNKSVVLAVSIEKTCKSEGVIQEISQGVVNILKTTYSR